jgi:hypothetical protein
VRALWKLSIFALALAGCREKREEASKASTGSYTVVLVAKDDVLNVRKEPNPSAEIVAKLAPGQKTVRSTGAVHDAGESRWLEIETAQGRGWVNSAYLVAEISSERFAADARPNEMLESLRKLLAQRGDLSSVVGRLGLHVHQFGGTVHYKKEDLPLLLSSEEKRKWNGPACGEACLEGTFMEVIGAPLLAVLSKPDRKIAVDRHQKGGNASADPPSMLSGFHFLSVMDPGTAQNDHLDWRSFSIYFDCHGGEMWIVAIVPDQWSP